MLFGLRAGLAGRGTGVVLLGPRMNASAACVSSSSPTWSSWVLPAFFGGPPLALVESLRDGPRALLALRGAPRSRTWGAREMVSRAVLVVALLSVEEVRMGESSRAFSTAN